jgi:hypothetical protein
MRGFALKQDHYTGVNFAFMLDLRAREAPKPGSEDAIIDHTLARRMRTTSSSWPARTWNGWGRRRRRRVLLGAGVAVEAALGVGDSAMARYELLRTMKSADWPSDTWQAQGEAACCSTIMRRCRSRAAARAALHR